MSRKVTTTIALTSVLFAGLLWVPDAAHARPLRGTYSGANHDTGVDPDGPGPAAHLFRADHQGNGPGGRFTLQNRSALFEWDEVSFCSSTEVLLHFFSYASIQRVANGDLIYSNLVDGSLCYDFVDDEFTFSIDLEIIGGTGRYEGATGWTTLEGQGKIVGDVPEFSGITGEFEGEIFF